MRTRPNIIITGTPGVGKTTHCEVLAQTAGLKHMQINTIVKDRLCHDGWDKDFGSWIVNEEKLLDEIEDELKSGGYIIDWHVCDIFPEAWIDLVVVIRCNSTLLYDRLNERGYSKAKLEENLDAEIMEVIIDEAREAYSEDMIVELRSDTAEDIEENVERIEAWIKAWNDNNGGSTT